MNLDEADCGSEFCAARRKSQVIAGLLASFATPQREILAARRPFTIRLEAPY